MAPHGCYAGGFRTSRAGLTDPKRPTGVFLLAGTSGVGKTKTALALAELLFGDESSLTVINMSEFKEEHEVSLLMGYVRYVLSRHKAANWGGLGRARKSTRPGANGVVEFTPFKFLDRLADLVPPPRKHRHRYHGVFAPNHKLRRAVTALADLF